MSNRGNARVVALIAILVIAAAGAAFWLSQKKQAEETERAAEAAFDQGASASMVAGALVGLPPDAFVLGAIPNLTAWGEAFRTTGPGKLLLDPALREKARAAAAVAAVPEPIRDLDSLLTTVSEIGELGLRSLAFAVTPLPPGGADRTGFVAVVACDDPENVRKWLAAKMAAEETQPPAPAAGTTPAATPASPAPAAATSGMIQGVRYTCDDGACWAVRANTVVVGRPLAALERFLALPAGGESPNLARLKAAIEQTGAAPEGAFLFADLKQAVAAAQPELAKDEEGKQAVEFLGLDGLDSLAFAQRIEGGLFRDHAMLRFDPARTGLVETLLTLPASASTSDRTVLPAGLTAASFGQLPDLAVTYDRVYEGLRKMLSPEEMAKLDQGIAMSKGFLGVDLRNDVLAAFGGEWAFAAMEPAASGASGASGTPGAAPPLATRRFLLVLGIKDQTKVDALLTRLGELGKSRGLKLETEPLGEGKLLKLPLPVAGAAPVLAVAKGRLWVGLEAEDVKAAVAGTGPMLAADPTFAKLRAGFPPEASAVAFNRAPGATLEQVYTSYVEGYRRTKQDHLDRTVGTLSAIATAVEAYRADNEGFVPRGRNLAELKTLLQPTWLKGVARTDAWGTPIGYAGRENGYAVWSLGEDATAERDWSACTGTCPVPAAAAPETEDLVIANSHALRGVKAGSGDEPVAPAFLPPPALADLGAALSGHLAGWSPSIAVVRGAAGTLDYEGLTPFEMGALPGFAGALALPRLLGQSGSGPEAGPGAGGNRPEGKQPGIGN